MYFTINLDAVSNWPVLLSPIALSDLGRLVHRVPVLQASTHSEGPVLLRLFANHCHGSSNKCSQAQGESVSRVLFGTHPCTQTADMCVGVRIYSGWFGTEHLLSSLAALSSITHCLV